MTYPRLARVECSICGADVELIIEQLAGQPRPIGGLMRVPFDYVPTVLAGCEHWYPQKPNHE